MGYRDFTEMYNDYILSLEDNVENHALTTFEWWSDITWENEDHAKDIKNGFYDSDNAPHIFTSEEIGWIIDRLKEDGFVYDRLWYVVQEDSTDTATPDWSNGHFDLEAAKRELIKLYTLGHENARIAVIDLSSHEATCIEELTITDI